MQATKQSAFGSHRWRGPLLGLGVLGVLLLASPRAEAWRIYEIDYAPYDARVTDTEGITTQTTEFGFGTGPNILTVRRGDAYVEIPFRKLRLIEIGKYIPAKGYSPATVVSRQGERFEVQLERIHGQRFLYGTTSVGSFRIRLSQVRRLELQKLSNTEDM